MKNNENLLSWQEAIKLNTRALLLLYKYHPKTIVSRMICAIWNSVNPYAGIYLSSLIISELAGNRNTNRLAELILITLFSTASISLISALLEKWRDTERTGNYFNIEHIYAQKLYSMDFVSIDDTKTHEMLSKIQQNQNANNWGLNRTLDNYESLISSVLSILGGITLTVSLFTSKVPESSGKYILFNHPVFILFIIAVMLSVTFISPILLNKSDSYWTLNINNHTLANRLIGHYFSVAFEKKRATDIRIYRQDLMCIKYSKNKTGIFSSNGPLAKICWGIGGLLKAASAAVSVIFTGVVYGFVCLKALYGAFGIGSVTRYIAAITKVSNSVSSLIAKTGEMRTNASFLKLLFEFLDIPNDMYQGSLTIEKRRDRDYDVEFKNVSFKYPGTETFVLKNINMKFKIGKRLAVVGEPVIIGLN